MAVDTSLSFVVTANAEQFETVMQNVARRTQTFEQQQAQVSANVAASSKRTSMALLEVGRGVEDFAMGFSTGGLAGGLRGATNNITQLATALNPATAGYVAIGAAITAVAVPAFTRMIDTTKIAENATKRATEANEAFNESLKRRRQLQEDLARIGKMDMGDAGEKLDDLDAQIAGDQRELLTINRQVQERRQQFERLQAELGGPAAFRDIEGGGLFGLAMSRMANPKNGNVTKTLEDALTFRAQAGDFEQQANELAKRIADNRKLRDEAQRQFDNRAADEQRAFASQFPLPQMVQFPDAAEMQSVFAEAQRRRELQVAQSEMDVMSAKESIAELQKALKPAGGQAPQSAREPMSADERALMEKNLEVQQQQLRTMQRMLDELKRQPGFTAVSE